MYFDKVQHCLTIVLNHTNALQVHVVLYVCFVLIHFNRDRLKAKNLLYISQILQVLKSFLTSLKSMC